MQHACRGCKTSKFLFQSEFASHCPNSSIAAMFAMLHPFPEMEGVFWCASCDGAAYNYSSQSVCARWSCCARSNACVVAIVFTIKSSGRANGRDQCRCLMISVFFVGFFGIRRNVAELRRQVGQLVELPRRKRFVIEGQSVP